MIDPEYCYNKALNLSGGLHPFEVLGNGSVIFDMCGCKKSIAEDMLCSPIDFHIYQDNERGWLISYNHLCFIYQEPETLEKDVVELAIRFKQTCLLEDLKILSVYKRYEKEEK